MCTFPWAATGWGQLRTIFNLLVVWFLTGFWHGASWNFVLWGLYFFVFLVLEKYVFTDRFQRTPKVVSHLLTLFVISFGWMIFRCDKLSYVGKIFWVCSASPATGSPTTRPPPP